MLLFKYIEPQNNEQVVITNNSNTLHQITPLSKYLAMVLFIIMPFVGAYIGYTLAPEKVMEVERVAYKEAASNKTSNSNNLANEPSPTTTNMQIYSNDEFGFSLSYPTTWTLDKNPDDGLGYRPVMSIYNILNPPVPNSGSGGDRISIALLEKNEQPSGYNHQCFDAVFSNISPTVDYSNWDIGGGMIHQRQLCMKIGNDIFSVGLYSENILATKDLQSEMNAIVDTLKLTE